MRGEQHGRVLLISNGHGEDQISAVLGGKLAQVAPDLTLSALPLVGAGRAYLEQGISVIRQEADLPSGGFSHNSLKNLLMDIKGGLFGQIAAQISTVKRIRNSIDLAVCVGDVYLLIIAGFFLKKPLFFIPTAKSDYISPHWRVEVSLMRRFCRRIFPRDAKTAGSLAQQGLPAIFVGNLMMDCLYFTDSSDFREENEWVIALLPGSRREAYDNMLDLAEVLVALEDLISKKGIGKPRKYLLALAGGLTIEGLGEKLKPLGWQMSQPTTEETGLGIEGHLAAPAEKQGFRVTVVKGRFADILMASDLVLGLAGTGNEQAVGLGKPVVTFPGRGPQFSEKFAQTQKKLLGDAVSLVAREPVVVAEEIIKILTSALIREKMGRIGQERMGDSGGAQTIALQIKEYFA